MKVEDHDIGTYLVHSETAKDVAYIVDYNQATCTCPVGMRLRRGVSLNCKHYIRTGEAIRNGEVSPAITFGGDYCTEG